MPELVPYALRLNDFSEYQGDWDHRVYPGMGGWCRTDEWRRNRGGPRPDQFFTRNVDKLAEIGRLRGSYSRANAPAEQPVSYVGRFVFDTRRAGLFAPGSLLPALDVEPTGDKAADAGVDWRRWLTTALEVWDTLTQGHPVLLYSSASYFASLFGGADWLPSFVSIWAAGSITWAPPRGGGQVWTPETYAGQIRVEGTYGRLLLHQYGQVEMPGLVPASGGVPGVVDSNALVDPMPGIARSVGDLLIPAGLS